MSVVELAPLVALLGEMVQNSASPPHMGVASQQKIFDTVRRLSPKDLLELLADRLVVTCPDAVKRGHNQPFARLLTALANECDWQVNKVHLFSDEKEKRKLTDWIKSVDFDRERVRDMAATLLQRVGAGVRPAGGGDAQQNDNVGRMVSEEEPAPRNGDAMARMRGLKFFENLEEEDVVATADATPEAVEEEAAMVEATVALENELAAVEAALAAEEEAAAAAAEEADAVAAALAAEEEAAAAAAEEADALAAALAAEEEAAAVEVGRPVVAMAVGDNNVLGPGRRWEFLGPEWKKSPSGIDVCASIYDKKENQQWRRGCTVTVRHASAKREHDAVVIAVGRCNNRPYVVLHSDHGQEFEQTPISREVTLDTGVAAVGADRVAELWAAYERRCTERNEEVEEVQLPVRKRTAVLRRGPHRVAKQDAATRAKKRPTERKKKEEVEDDDEDDEDEEDDEAEVARPKKPARRRKATKKPIVILNQKEEKVKVEDKRKEPRSRSSSRSRSPRHHRSRSCSPQRRRLHRHHSRSRSPVACCSCHAHHEESHRHTGSHKCSHRHGRCRSRSCRSRSRSRSHSDSDNKRHKMDLLQKMAAAITLL